MRGRVLSDVRPRPIKLEDKTFMFLFSAILKADAKVRCLLERCLLTHPQNDTTMRISFKQHFILHISRVAHEKSSFANSEGQEPERLCLDCPLGGRVDESIFGHAGGIYFSVVPNETKLSREIISFVSFWGILHGNRPWTKFQEQRS